VKKLNWTELSIVVAEDEDELRGIMCSMLQMEGSKVFAASNGNEAFDIIQREKIDIIISDVQMPHCTGLQLLEKIQPVTKKPALFLVTGFADVTETEAKKKGATSLIHKPFSLEKLKTTVSEALKENEEFKLKYA
jgi:DNA-binding NtrC family response regulator